MSADGGALDLMMYAPIGSDYWGDGSMVDAKAIAEKLAANKSVKQINLAVSSVGGDAFHAVAIYTALKEHPARVVATIEGLCASAMAIVVCAADEIVMSEAGLFMIHEASWGTYGFAAEQEAALNATKAVNEISANIIAARSGQSVATIKQMMNVETWMTAEDAKAKGFVNRTMPLKTMSASAGSGMFLKVPEAVRPLLAKLIKESESMDPAPTPTPAPTPAPAASGGTTPPAPAPTPAPVATVPAVPATQPTPPVAQPVAMTADQATKRATGIMAACVLAKKPELATKYVEDPMQTVESVQQALLQMVCAGAAPPVHVPAANAGGNPVPPADNHNARFEQEWEAAKASMTVSKEDYVKCRRIDEGLDKLQAPGRKK